MPFVKYKVVPGHTTKAYGRSRGIAPPSLNSCTRWVWVVNFTPQSLYTPRKNTDSHWIGGWVGPRDSLKVLKKRKHFFPLRGFDSNPRIVTSNVTKLCSDANCDWTKGVYGAVTLRSCIERCLIKYRAKHWPVWLDVCLTQSLHENSRSGSLKFPSVASLTILPTSCHVSVYALNGR